MKSLWFAALASGLMLAGCCTAHKSTASNETSTHTSQHARAEKPAAPTASTTEIAVNALRELSGGVRFRTSRADVNAADQKRLAALAKAVKADSSLKVEVKGYSDSAGNPAKNEVLSKKRAESVAEILKKYGVPSDRVSASGHASENPVQDNRTLSGRAANRRVEISVN